MRPVRVRSQLRGVLSRACRRLRQEQGFSLVLAISIIAVLTVATFGITDVVTSNERSASRETDTSRAFFNAEYALGMGQSAMSQADPTNVAPPQTLSGNGNMNGNTTRKASTYSFQAVKSGSGAGAVWTITGSGAYGKVSRTLRLLVSAVMNGSGGTTTTETVSPAWGWGIFIGSSGTQSGTSGCNAPLSLSGGATVRNSIFVNGDVCLTGGAAIVQDTTINPSGTSVYIGGKFYSLRGAGIGTQASRITSATIVKGCQKDSANVTCSGPAPTYSGANSNVWSANGVSSTAQPGVSFPTIDADGWYQNAVPGPNHPCFTNFAPAAGGKFDNNGTRNASLLGPNSSATIDLITPSWNNSTAYTCTSTWTDPNGIDHTGTIKWEHADSTPGTLTVNGTIFIDGNLRFGATNDQAQYQGHGTIYVDGTVTFTNGATLCAVYVGSTTCGSNWNPADASLTIVAINQNGTNPLCSGHTNASFCMLGDAKFQGAAIARGPVYETNSSYVIGPIMTDSKADLAGGVVFPPFNQTACIVEGFNICIPGAPGVTTTTTQTSSFGGWDITGNNQWQEIK